MDCSALTEREREVLGHLTGGLTDAAMAELLGVSIRTVNNHVSSVLSKLDVPNRTSAVVAAVTLGLAESP